MSGNEVNWSTLRRATPLFASGQKDDWHTVEISRDAALMVPAKDVGCGLHLCADDESHDFVLERRIASPPPIGNGWVAGQVTDAVSVARDLPSA